MRRAREFLLSAGGAIAALVIAGSLGLVIVTLGLFDVSASTPHMPLIGKIVHSTMVHSVARSSSDIDPPKSVTERDIRSGFCQYREHCEMCHGGPAVGRPHWVNGMNPAPPYLVDARTRWSRGELFWIVHQAMTLAFAAIGLLVLAIAVALVGYRRTGARREAVRVLQGIARTCTGVAPVLAA